MASTNFSFSIPDSNSVLSHNAVIVPQGSLLNLP